MKKEWVNPNDIFVHRELNNREINRSFIGDLIQSMQDKGFLPEYPIDIFRSKNLANIDTDLPYVCACGAHRTLAAIDAKLEQVLAIIHDGREEAFVEMMHLDNFKFDPARNSGIGQPFTQKEKRAAITQLLLLPKYFEKTNTALEEQLRVHEASIRRWRKDVVKFLEEDHHMLKVWGVSDGRIKRLKELAQNPERKDSEGKTVKIRKPLAEPTEDEKKAFYGQIEEDSWIPGEKHNFDWNHVCTYMQRLWDTEDGRWYIYKEVSMQQLQKVHHLILSEDEDFIKEVVKIARTEKRVRVQRDSLNKAADVTIDTFKKIFAPKEDKHATEYKELCKRFLTFVKKSDPKFSQFEIDYYEYDWKDRDDPEFCEKEAGLHHAVASDLTGEADWLQDFREKETKRMQKLRENAMKRWEKNHKEALDAIQAYPRKVSEYSLLSTADRILGRSRGVLPKIAQMEAPSTQKYTSSISEEASLFKKLAYALNNNVQWVKDIPESKPLVSILTSRGDTEETDDPLGNMSLEDIFEHLKSRVEDTSEVSGSQTMTIKREIIASLEKSGYGIFNAQVWILSDIGSFLCQTKEVFKK